MIRQKNEPAEFQRVVTKYSKFLLARGKFDLFRNAKFGFNALGGEFQFVFGDEILRIAARVQVAGEVDHLKARLAEILEGFLK